MSLLLELWPMAKLVVKQSAKAHGPLLFFGGCGVGINTHPLSCTADNYRLGYGYQ